MSADVERAVRRSTLASGVPLVPTDKAALDRLASVLGAAKAEQPARPEAA